MKKLLVIIMIMIIFMFLLDTASAETPDTLADEEIKQDMEIGVQQQLEELDVSQWEQLLDDLKRQGNSAIKETNVKKLINDLITGKSQLDTWQLLQEILKILFNEVADNLGLMAQIIVLAILCGITKNLQNSFEESTVGDIAYFACYIIIIILIIQSLISVIDVGKSAINQMVSFMQMLFPTLLALLIAMGGIASSSIFQPAIGFLVGIVSSFLNRTMIPMIILTAVLTIIHHTSEKIQLNRLRNLIKNLCSWTLVITFTVFIGVLAVQGALAASVDGISIRTAKYAINTFVPIVGGLFAQSVDTIIGCSLLVKNAAGITALITIAMICLYPALKILALIAIYKFSSALLEPVTDGKIVECLNDVGSVLNILFVTVVGIGIMFFLTVALIISTGNITVMMR